MKKCSIEGCGKLARKGRTLCSGHNISQWRSKNPVRAAWHELRNKCKRKRRHLGLTYEQFEEFCTTTGYTDGSGRHRHNFHIDRIDPRKGYTVDNIQVLTCAENVAKGNRERHFCDEEEEPGECPF